MAEWENVSVEAVAVDREDGMDMFWVWLDLLARKRAVDTFPDLLA